MINGFLCDWKLLLIGYLFHISAQAARAFTFSLQSKKVNKEDRRCCPITLNDSIMAERKELAPLQTAFLSDRLHSIVLNAIGQRRVFILKNCIVIWELWSNWFHIKGISKDSFVIGNFY